jgi:hypothetical protein
MSSEQCTKDRSEERIHECHPCGRVVRAWALVVLRPPYYLAYLTRCVRARLALLTLLSWSEIQSAYPSRQIHLRRRECLSVPPLAGCELYPGPPEAPNAGLTGPAAGELCCNKACSLETVVWESICDCKAREGEKKGNCRSHTTRQKKGTMC